MMTTIKPFERGFFTCHNAITDVFMPKLSGSAFKLLICALRQTEGWNKQKDTIAYSQFKAKTGIASNTTIARGLSELLEAGYLLRFQVGTCAGTNKPIYAYSLNTDYEFSSPENEQASPENGQVTCPENGQEASPENGQTTLHHTNKHADDDLLITALQDFGLSEKLARKLAIGANLEDTQGWIDFIDSNESITNPIGFLVCKLRDREKPPQPKEDDNPASSWIAAGALH